MKLKNWIRRSFRNRVFATILVVTLVPAAAVRRGDDAGHRGPRGAHPGPSGQSGAGHAVPAVRRGRGQCGDTLEALATSTITRSVLRRTEPDSRLLYQFLYRSAAAVRSYADLEIYDAQGACLYSTDASLAAAPADTGLGRAVRRRTNGGTVFLSTGHGLMAARTVTGYGGELLGYVTARIESSGFAQLFDGVMAPADDLLVLDSTWRTVYYTRTVQADRTVAALRSQLLAGQKLTGDEGDDCAFYTADGAAGFTLLLQQPRVYTGQVLPVAVSGGCGAGHPVSGAVRPWRRGGSAGTSPSR